MHLCQLSQIIQESPGYRIILSDLLCRSPPRYEVKRLCKKIVKLTLADFWHFSFLFFGRGWGWVEGGEFRIFKYILVVDHNIMAEVSVRRWSSIN